jgi:uncharacterized Zn finger protein
VDPFEVFTWRGRHRDELLMRLRRLREEAAVNATDITDDAKTASREESSTEPESLLIDPDDPEAFWGRSLDLGESADQESGGRSDALLDQLDPPRATYQGRPLNEVLRPAYRYLSDTSGVGRTD